jgi:3'(2'), 5'-bisphosphate nucleotidase
VRSVGGELWDIRINWTNDIDEKDGRATRSNSRGIMMASHVGCGTWSRQLSGEIGQFTEPQDIWKRCFVDSCSVVHMTRYCITGRQTWDMIPLSVLFSSTSDKSDLRDANKILLIPVFLWQVCCTFHYCFFVAGLLHVPLEMPTKFSYLY